MQEVYKFIASHYQIIGSAIVFIISLVFFIIRKKPVSDIGSKIASYCIQGVILAEKSSEKGLDKLNIAIKYVEDCLLAEFPDLDISLYYFTIKNNIEWILKTPQKKGEK